MLHSPCNNTPENTRVLYIINTHMRFLIHSLPTATSCETFLAVCSIFLPFKIGSWASSSAVSNLLSLLRQSIDQPVSDIIVTRGARGEWPENHVIQCTAGCKRRRHVTKLWGNILDKYTFGGLNRLLLVADQALLRRNGVLQKQELRVLLLSTFDLNYAAHLLIRLECFWPFPLSSLPCPSHLLIIVLCHRSFIGEVSS